ncbi:MAG: glycosyltransferase family 1 protein [Anaerolineales bacterium]|nr:MAG: glycosyltransferase family 1 protein [Anaerolineales bacterium]
MSIEPGYIFYLGGFDKRKNLSAVIRAFAIVKGACDETVLVIAGKLPQEDTPFTPDPRRLAAEAGLPQNSVRFLGFVPESAKPALYRGARLFIFPSEYEGFGYPPLEALACGTPVVGSHTASMPEIVGDAGVLLAPSDTEGLAGAMIHILTDDGYHAELRHRAINQAAKFSWQRTAVLTFDAYHQALSLYA